VISALLGGWLAFSMLRSARPRPGK